MRNNSKWGPCRPLATSTTLAVVVFLSAAASASGQVGLLGPSHAAGDIDGDGITDHVFGYPSWNGGRGAIVVITGSGTASQFGEDYPASNDFFGDSVSVGDVDGDGFEDVVVGVPGLNVGGLVDAGAIHVFYGTEGGLTTVGDQIVHRNSPGIGSASAEWNARFGESVAVADFNCDGYDDVAIGAPLDDAHPGRIDDGSINVIYGSYGGLTTVDSAYHQGTADVSGAPETDDQFGGALAVGNFNGDQYFGRPCMDLAVGVPGENTDHGYVVFFYGHHLSMNWNGDLVYQKATGLAQNTSGADGAFEAHDAFGALMWAYHDSGAHDDLLVGVPGETCGDGRRGGIHRFFGTSQGFVTGNSLNYAGDILQCVDWNDGAVFGAFIDYERCIDRSGIDCLSDSELTLRAEGLLVHSSTTAACLNAIEIASDRCEHWISDPVCDIDACIAAALELNTMATDCALDGDIVTHAYPIQ